ncbi:MULTISPECIES: phosphatidate cytidylyltransferase [unclassified Undibacterium]|uniref:phosphatidate cytidylyltransferase n=1 Tax=unclassified Undibacterium TaxID=2630295 RepID=UPI002AC9A8E1|nr:MULTISPECIES: phosphatidate cytidylyltransferase [unclassified Undibacterium]MEB0138543.1 phosphatidate cytidylyltransferase [Undibacterium sp. CCC2.1]MEB0171393.1 phosphatidate cytidylyltransferase [Undibacterium sp. CCC1.1]MEB0175307.1 phosphatidate cytidylyltransferase [Undibacterium sp. CCC3.4]MEB0214589.1 phosphatidate cytidylyltransferase [Undibacterium sp. 5I2]WPX43036.1 phosphatidate cytidylyltransferase [Undibacterium sp. CCC3.4]
MLKTRIITALILLAILLPVLYSANFFAFSAIVLAFFAAAIWECQRLFKKPLPLLMSAVWTAFFGYLLFHLKDFSAGLLFALCVAFWLLRLTPLLARGLPGFGFSNGILSTLYGICIFGCFTAIAVLFTHSPLYLLSVMVIVWVADIGAYFSGKAFGKHKLAPSISPGKSWEGAIGGWVMVLLLGVGSTLLPALQQSFAAQILHKHGYAVLLLVLSVLAAASVVGDLFESMLKRRAGMKDSSNLLPGHGGVLDRIDALIPVLPLAALSGLWF